MLTGISLPLTKGKYSFPAAFDVWYACHRCDPETVMAERSLGDVLQVHISRQIFVSALHKEGAAQAVWCAYHRTISR